MSSYNCARIGTLGLKEARERELTAKIFDAYHSTRQPKQFFSKGWFLLILVKCCSSSVGPPMLKPNNYADQMVYSTCHRHKENYVLILCLRY